MLVLVWSTNSIETELLIHVLQMTTVLWNLPYLAK